MSVLLNALKKAALEKQQREAKSSTHPIIASESQAFETEARDSDFSINEGLELCIELEDIRDELKKEAEIQSPKIAPDAFLKKMEDKNKKIKLSSSELETFDDTEEEKTLEASITDADHKLSITEEYTDSELIDSPDFTEVTELVEPTKPTESAKAVEPSISIESSIPIEPPKPVEPSKPVELAEPPQKSRLPVVDNRTLNDELIEKNESSEVITETKEPISAREEGLLKQAQIRNQRTQKEALSDLIRNSQKQHKRATTRRVTSLSLLGLVFFTGIGIYTFHIVTAPPDDLKIVEVPTDIVDKKTIQDSVILIEGDPFEPISGLLALQKELARSNTDNLVVPIDEPNTTYSLSKLDLPVVKKPAPKEEISDAMVERTEKGIVNASNGAKKDTAEEKDNNKILIKQGKPLKLKLSKTINQAYALYQQGNYDQAKRFYQEALATDSHHRDALLGLAAIAIKQNNNRLAFDYYQKRLSVAPNDAYAHAGIISLFSDQKDNSELSSKLKNLLNNQPNSPSLHFIQGSFYATNEQWPKAQQSFFSAWSLEKTNADYALNLAITLDRMNQPKAALNYYNLALTYGENKTSIDTNAISQRIDELKKVNL